jgi:hypothetical protein
MRKRAEKLSSPEKSTPFDLLWHRLKVLASTQAIYEQNLNLPQNVRMANICLVQNDILALEKKIHRYIKKIQRTEDVLKGDAP